MNSKVRKKHGSPWLSVRRVLSSTIFACLIAIAVVKFDFTALATDISAYSDRLFVNDIVPSLIIRKDEPILDNLLGFAQDQFHYIFHGPANAHIPVPDPPDAFDFAKAARACGWPDLSGFGITVDVLLKCLEAEERKFEESEYDWA